MHLLKVGGQHFAPTDVISFELGEYNETRVELSGRRTLFFADEKKAAVDFFFSQPEWWDETRTRFARLPYSMSAMFIDLVEEYRKAISPQGASPERQAAS